MEPTEDPHKTVLHLVGMGASLELIAYKLKCTPRDVRRRFKAELKLGAEAANVAVTESLFLDATDRQSVPAAMNWLKERAGWGAGAAESVDTSPVRVIVRGQDADGQVRTLTTDETAEPPGIA